MTEPLVSIMNITRLFIIEDHPLILSHHKKMLTNFNDIFICGAAMAGDEAIKRSSYLSSPPHVILCDIGAPTMDSLASARAVKALYPHSEIVVFTAFEDENLVLKAIIAGASGYLLKGVDVDIEKIRAAIIDVHNGGCVIQPTLTRKLLKYFAMPKHEMQALSEQHDKKQSGHRSSLTMRELECLQIIAKGLSNQETASVLRLSIATIRTHLEHIYQKLEVSNRVEAITEGIRQGIIDL
jgi:DNA-binding NarL/FixJ family response regulator